MSLKVVPSELIGIVQIHLIGAVFWSVLCSSNCNHWSVFSSFCCSVKSRRRFVGPNPGFISQLHLYETMKWQVDKANVQFRMYRLQVAANQVKKGR